MIADSAKSATPTEGSSQVRRQMLARNSSAHTMAMPARISLAGSTALSSVYPMPVKIEPELVTRSKRSSQ